MKKFIFAFIAFSVAVGLFTACDKNENGTTPDQIISANDLPAKSQTFISDYFSGYTVQSASKSSTSYNVTLTKAVSGAPSLAKSVTSNSAPGYEIKFDLNGVWIEIEGHNDSALPESVLSLIPRSIVSYVAEFHPGRSITEIEKESYGYYVELTGKPDVELKFDTNGTIIASSTGNDDNDDDVVIAENQLPANAQTFLSTHYNGIAITKATKDNDSYDVDLANGAEIEFDINGNWKEIDANRSTIPQSVVNSLPAGIGQYLSTNFANIKIDEIKKGLSSYKIELANDVELVFDNSGNLWNSSNNNSGHDNDDDNDRVDISALPQVARDILNTHFANETVLYVEKDDDEFEVKLSSGTSVDFALNGSLKKVEVMPGNSVPSALIPANITSYVNSNYSGKKIEEFEVKTNGYKIELSGYPEIELLFDSNGNFLRID